jgi:transposase, IS6 family
MNQQNPFKWRHFEAEIILLCVRWYLRSSLSYRDLEEMMRERGLQVDHTTIYRWVQCYAPELEKRCRPHVKAFTDSWKVDETYINVRKTWMYLYRAVDSQGNTLEFLLSATRDAEAAKRFFVKALHSTVGSAPQPRPVERQMAELTAAADPKTTTSALRVITVDKNAAYPKAIAQLKAAGILAEQVELRQVKYLNNLINAATIALSNDSSSQGWASFPWKRQGERCKATRVMHMIRKGQMQGVNKGDITGQVTFIASLFGMVA